MNLLHMLADKLRGHSAANGAKAEPLASAPWATQHTPEALPTLTVAPPTAAAPEADNLTMEQALTMFTKVREMLGEDTDTSLAIPCQALLQQLPPHLRGAAWNANAFPKTLLDVPRDAVLDQLKKGQIQFELRDFLPILPPDWVKAEPATLVNLDLALVVEAIPAQWFQAALPTTQTADGVKHIPDYFKPATPVARPTAPPPPPASALPVAEAAPVGGTPSAPPPKLAAPPRVLRPGEWDGVEIGPDAGANVVDINHADLQALLKLPGIGPLRAEAILTYRQQHEKFRTIFELAEVPGVGRKLFKQVTGLTLRRRDRHDTLCRLLGLEKTDRPTLTQLAAQLCTLGPVTGCVFSNREGMPLAIAGLTPDEAAPYAAIVPQLFRRARRYLTALDPQPVQTLVLPFGAKPAVLVQGCEFCLILTFPPGASLDPLLQRLADLAGELDWLQSPRALVAP